MANNRQFRSQSLAFAKALQTTLKTILMYSVDHPAAVKPVAQAFTTLAELCRHAGQVTVGFARQRILLNELSTDDTQFLGLKLQFSKRGIAATRFSAGISLHDFKRTLALLATNPQWVEDQGGIAALLQQNPIPSFHVCTDFESDSLRPQANSTADETSPDLGIASDLFPLQDLCQARDSGLPLQAEAFDQMLISLLDLVNRGETDKVFQAAEAYLNYVDGVPDEFRESEVARAPRFLAPLVSGPSSGVAQRLAAHLCARMSDGRGARRDWHQQLVSCLVAAATVASGQENFLQVHQIGVTLERFLDADLAGHAECCGQARNELLSSGAAARLVELFLEHREDHAFARMATDLLRWAGSRGCETVFLRLEEESAAPYRMRLMRLLAQMGPAGIEPARKRLRDSRWYVVRNACRILGDLGDPDLCNQLSEALQRGEPRVQQAALTAIIRGQAPGRARLLAESLPHLRAQLLELALDELLLLKDEGSIPGLQQFLSTRRDERIPLLKKAVIALAAIPGAQAAQALTATAGDTTQPPAIQRAAAEFLSRHPSASGASAPLPREEAGLPI